MRPCVRRPTQRLGHLLVGGFLLRSSETALGTYDRTINLPVDSASAISIEHPIKKVG